MQRMRAGVAAIGATDPFAPLQLVQHAGQPRPLDAERSAPIAACERPGLASTISSTEYCAGRTFIGASVRMKSWKIQICRRRTK